MTSFLPALAGGALIGLAASLAWIAHGRIAGISGTVGRVFAADGGAAFRVPFLAGLIAVGALAAWLRPGAFGAAVRGTPALALAGLLVGVGTALANGCTSGHGVCGLSRLSFTSARPGAALRVRRLSDLSFTSARPGAALRVRRLSDLSARSIVAVVTFMLAGGLTVALVGARS